MIELRLCRERLGSLGVVRGGRCHCSASLPTLRGIADPSQGSGSWAHEGRAVPSLLGRCCVMHAPPNASTRCQQPHSHAATPDLLQRFSRLAIIHPRSQPPLEVCPRLEPEIRAQLAQQLLDAVQPLEEILVGAVEIEQKLGAAFALSVPGSTSE